MNATRIIDIVGLSVAIVVTIYGAIFTPIEAFLLPGLTILFYAYMLLYPSEVNGKIWIIIIPPMIIFLFLFVLLHLGETWILSVIMIACTIRVVILIVKNSRLNNKRETLDV